ncbi:MAG TPA: DUF1993 domain-containing protein [Caulobacteraceae bacterium]|nr:DUF1993 domain-containing protein [Caulobacteraceae bacterium]
MTISLYDASVASYLQLLGGVSGFLDRGVSHCEENGLDLGEIVETSLFPDMLPFRFQIQAVAHHSLGAMKGLKAGVFHPSAGVAKATYQNLQALVADTRSALAALSPEEVNALSGKDMAFEAGDFRMLFTSETFILSFSLPNFYFHATTAYDILRMKGVPLGKRDFVGQRRTKG